MMKIVIYLPISFAFSRFIAQIFHTQCTKTISFDFFHSIDAARRYIECWFFFPPRLLPIRFQTYANVELFNENFLFAIYERGGGGEGGKELWWDYFSLFHSYSFQLIRFCTFIDARGGGKMLREKMIKNQHEENFFFDISEKFVRDKKVYPSTNHFSKVP